MPDIGGGGPVTSRPAHQTTHTTDTASIAPAGDNGTDWRAVVPRPFRRLPRRRCPRPEECTLHVDRPRTGWYEYSDDERAAVRLLLADVLVRQRAADYLLDRGDPAGLVAHVLGRAG
jgi:hypothetical protein